MPKIRTKYVCQECGSNFPKWVGKCPECNNWNSLIEEVFDIANEQNISKKNSALGYIKNNVSKAKAQKLQDIEIREENRIVTRFSELNRVLGGGIVEGSISLLGGDPGIGKSTILFQVGFELSLKDKKVLYVTGEESSQQVLLRARRMSMDKSENFYLVSETNINSIVETIIDIMPNIAIIDSVQAVYDPKMESSPGSISQIKNTTQLLLHVAKTHNIALIVIGHVTKEGSLAGPKVLEHMVDTVMYFEGERYKTYRLIRSVKNRFGATNEVGVFDMTSLGIEEVTNPSGLFLSEFSGNNSGSCVIATVEGTRPLLVELQSLVYQTYSTIPRRSTIGFEYNRLNQILAIIEKRIGLNLSKSDVLVNVVGGLKVEEPSADLGVAMAVISSYRDIIIPSDVVIIGELGLGGEVRSVTQIESRIKEASKLGFKKVVIPQSSLPLKEKINGIEIIPVKKLLDAVIKLTQS